ncbi:hypothetical protein KC19_4G209200 [Ceratodon purpureus]|uniref:Uncharacterized protein n=1 Tax=Ceratodon purpureus TaxID=3225 RepID=A0A8T0IBW0_CERPU|nr:hypothetical protein KC19_4G209200 [Ceratodon purpureus]
MNQVTASPSNPNNKMNTNITTLLITEQPNTTTVSPKSSKLQLTSLPTSEFQSSPQLKLVVVADSSRCNSLAKSPNLGHLLTESTDSTNPNQNHRKPPLIQHQNEQTPASFHLHRLKRSHG